jgi:hypothetical protein
MSMLPVKFSKACRYLILTLSFFFQTVYGQIDSSRLEFFPLHKGDLWQYYVGPYGSLGVIQNAVVQVQDTMLPNGSHYALVTGSPYSGPTKYYRIDSLLRVEEYGSFFGDSIGQPPHEVNTFRLGEKDSSTWQIGYNIANLLYGAPYFLKFNSISQFYAFGQVRDVLEFQAGGTAVDTVAFGYSSWLVLMQGIGLYRTEFIDGNSAELTGAIVNGIQYGTIQTHVETIASHLVSFSLDQNYPNPFNSTTLIRFSMSHSDMVRLVVYDILGQQIAILVNGRKEAGLNTISFDATHLPSGVYFYTLRAEGRRETKRMILIR